MSIRHLETGKRGEDLTIEHLERSGWMILDRNYQFERNEIDIVAYDNKAIVFIEVKTRSSLRFGHPEESVDELKQSRIRKTAMAWLYERKMEKSPVRFDVVSVLLDNTDQPKIEHMQGAF